MRPRRDRGVLARGDSSSVWSPATDDNPTSRHSGAAKRAHATDISISTKQYDVGRINGLAAWRHGQGKWTVGE